jgi:hypothetical protein
MAMYGAKPIHYSLPAAGSIWGVARIGHCLDMTHQEVTGLICFSLSFDMLVSSGFLVFDWFFFFQSFFYFLRSKHFFKLELFQI